MVAIMADYISVEKLTAIASRMIHCIVSPSLRNVLVIALNYFYSFALRRTKRLEKLGSLSQAMKKSKMKTEEETQETQLWVRAIGLKLNLLRSLCS
jgi:hypothetical protein